MDPTASREERLEQLKLAKIKRELWLRGNLEWKLHSGQKRVYDNLKSLPSETREALLFISRRWGKTYLGLIMAIQDCLQGPHRQVFIVGPTLKQTLRIIVPLLNEICADAPDGVIKRTKSDSTWTIGDSTLMIGAFDTAVESFRGLKAFNIYLEESGLADAEEFMYILNSILRPTLMHSRGRITHLTTPAKTVDHPLHTETLPKTQTQNAFFKYSIHDNPLLTPEEIEQEIFDMGGLESVHVQRELFCNLVKDAQTTVIPEFQRNTHVTQIKHVRHATWLSAIDFGGTRDKHAMLSAFYDFKRAKIVVVRDRLLDINTGTEQVIDACHDMEFRAACVWYKDIPKRVCDAAGQTHVDIRRLNFQCFLPLKGRDSVEEGINALRVAFTRGEIEIDESCKDLIACLEHGQWNKQRTDFMRTAALGHCDMIAALLYLFRHIDKQTNPYPFFEGARPQTHYIPEVKRDDTVEAALEAAWTLE